MSDASNPLAPQEPSLAGPHVRLKRHPERGSHARADVFAVIDEALICHVAFAADGCAMTLPTAHARIGDQLYLHGAVGNRMLRALCDAERASVTFTLLDGLVLARTAFHHSMNFRTAVVFGRASEVTDPDEKQLALHALVEHMAPGRMRELTQPTDAELKVTRVVRVDIEEASLKARAGHPLDGEGDLALDVWAGTVPFALVPSAPVPDPRLRDAQPMSKAAERRSWLQPSAAVVSQQRGEYTFSSDTARVDLPFVHGFLRDESYWARGLDADALQCALRNSVCFGVYRIDQQIGFARVVSDGSRIAYLADVFIDAAFRGRGLGTQLIEFVLAHPSVRDAHRVLLGTRDAHDFYDVFGFVRCPPERYMIRLHEDAPGSDEPR